MSSTIAEFRTLSRCAHVPKRAYEGSAGYDLWAAEAKTLKPWGRELIRLDMAMTISKGCYGQIVGRSRLTKLGIVVHGGTIDSDDRGGVCVVLFNLSNEECTVKIDNRIAQLIIERYTVPKFVLVNEFTKGETERGEKGFDSSEAF